MRLFTAIFMMLGTLAMSAQHLPIDPTIRYGKLDNGLTYYICPNEKAMGKTEFYIVQRVGSILEEENQQLPWQISNCLLGIQWSKVWC